MADGKGGVTPRRRGGRPRAPKEYKAWELQQQQQLHLHRVRGAVAAVDDSQPMSVDLRLSEYRQRARQREEEKWKEHIARVTARMNAARQPCPPDTSRTMSPPRPDSARSPQPPRQPNTARPVSASDFAAADVADASSAETQPVRRQESIRMPPNGVEVLSSDPAVRERYLVRGYYLDMPDGYYYPSTERTPDAPHDASDFVVEAQTQRSGVVVQFLREGPGATAKAWPRRRALAASAAASVVILSVSAECAVHGLRWRRTLVAALAVQHQACKRLTCKLENAEFDLRAAEKLHSEAESRIDDLEAAQEECERRLAEAEERELETSMELADMRRRAERAEKRSGALIDELRTVLQQRSRHRGGIVGHVEERQRPTAVMVRGTPGTVGDGTYLATEGGLSWEGPRGWRLVWQETGVRLWRDRRGRWCIGDLSKLQPRAVSLSTSPSPLELDDDAVGARWAGLRTDVDTVVLGARKPSAAGLRGEVGCTVDSADGCIGDADFLLCWRFFDADGFPLPVLEPPPAVPGAISVDLDKLPPSAAHVMLIASLPCPRPAAAAAVAILAVSGALSVSDRPPDAAAFAGGSVFSWIAVAAATLGAVSVLAATAADCSEASPPLPRILGSGEALPIFADGVVRAQAVWGVADLRAGAAGLVAEVLCQAKDGTTFSRVSPAGGSVPGIRLLLSSACVFEIDLQLIPEQVSNLRFALSGAGGGRYTDTSASMRFSGEPMTFGDAEANSCVDCGVSAVGTNDGVIAAALSRVSTSRRCWMLRCSGPGLSAGGISGRHELHIRIAASGLDVVAGASAFRGCGRAAVAVISRMPGDGGWSARTAVSPLPRDACLPGSHLSALLPPAAEEPRDGSSRGPFGGADAAEEGRSEDVVVRPGGGGEVIVSSCRGTGAGEEALAGEYATSEERVFGELVWRPTDGRGRWCILPPGNAGGGPFWCRKEKPFADMPGPHQTEWGAGISASASNAPTFAVGLRVRERQAHRARDSECEALAWAQHCSRLARQLAGVERRLARASEAASPLLAAGAVSAAPYGCSDAMLDESLLVSPDRDGWSEELWTGLSQPPPIDAIRLGGAARALRAACAEAEGDVIDELQSRLRLPPDRDAVETLSHVLMSPNGLAARASPPPHAAGPLALLLLRLVTSSSADTDRLLLWTGAPVPGAPEREADYRLRLQHQSERRNVGLMLGFAAGARALDAAMSAAAADVASVEEESMDIPAEYRQSCRTLAALWALGEASSLCPEFKRSKGEAWRVLVPGPNNSALRRVVSEHRALAGLPMGERRVAGYAAPILVSLSERQSRRRAECAGSDAILLHFKGLAHGHGLRDVSPCPNENSVLVPPFTLFNVGAVSGGDGISPLEIVMTFRESLARLPEFSPFVAGQYPVTRRAAERLCTAARASTSVGDVAQVPMLLPATSPSDAVRIAARTADAAEALLRSPVDVVRVSQLPAARGWEATLSCPAAMRQRFVDWVSDTRNADLACAQHFALRPGKGQPATFHGPVPAQTWWGTEGDGSLGVMDFGAQIALTSDNVSLRVLMRPERFEPGPLMDFLADTFPPSSSSGSWELLGAEPATTGMMTDVHVHCVSQRGAAAAATLLLEAASKVADTPQDAGGWPYVVVSAWRGDKRPPLETKWSVYDCAQSYHHGSSVLYGDPPGKGSNRGRLSSSGAWAPAADDPFPWYRLDAGAVREMAGVVLLGRADCAHDSVQDFAVEVSADGEHWQPQLPERGECPDGARWRGPVNGAVRYAYFAEAVRTRHVRLLLPRRGQHEAAGVCALRAGLIVALRPGEAPPLSDQRISRAAQLALDLRRLGVLKGATLVLGKQPQEWAAGRQPPPVAAADLTLLAAAGEVVRVRWASKADAAAPARLRDTIRLAPQLLVSLSLERCGITADESVALGKLLRLCSRLSLLDLDSNDRFDDVACRLVAAALRSIPTLEEVRLAHCKVSDKGVALLSAAMKDGCRGLRCIRLSGNRAITSHSRGPLFELVDGTDLVHIELVGTAVSTPDQEDLAAACKEKRSASDYV
eukprot:TRINITY_DN21212_c0_g1_i1.p1 TRINITY_DN21212_c0_g1~~TRINITY_DN21212_c0_g1_i1.p1  ORF type:complete len:2032 (+),score=439.60 TRINITY_DN21212_c0_g1_i1:60-6155(+)